MTETRRAELESLIEEAVALVLAGQAGAVEPRVAREAGPLGLASSFLAAGSRT